MEKAIKLVMLKDKTIAIFVNEEEKHKIEAGKRSISAEAIYKIIDFSVGDNYTVSSENETDVDGQVLDFFTGLLNDVVNKVDALQVEDDAVETTATEYCELPF